MSFKTRRIREEADTRGDTPAKISRFVRLGGFLGGWYAQWKAREKEAKAEQKRVRFLKKFAIVLVAVLGSVLLIAGTVKALIALQILTPSRIFAVAGKDLPKDADGFTNILLVGGGDKSHDGVDLLDSIMVASVDPTKSKSVALISIPRDLYIERTEKMGKGRINALYRDYKGYLRYTDDLPEAEASELALAELSKEVSNILGLTIHRVVKIDFIAFVEAVDALGGVDVEVPYDIVDPEYPGPDYSYQTFSIGAGPQHLDGETALKYARSRHTTSDFGRSARQQQLIQALAEKAKTEGIATSPGKITAFLKILSEHVETDLTVAEMLGAGSLAEKIERTNVLAVQLHTENGYDGSIPAAGGFLYFPPRAYYNGASVIRPVVIGGDDEWAQIRAFVALLTHSRSTILAHPDLVLLNAGAATGQARTLGNELTRNGFVVAEIENASDDRKSPLRNLPTSIVVARAQEDAQLAEFFATLLQIPVGQAPAELPPEKLGQVTVLVGKDYDFVPLRTLVPVPALTTENSSL